MSGPLSFLKTIVICILSCLPFQILNGQDLPFNCDHNAYLFQNNDVYTIDLASGSSFEVATDITEGNINATGYNTVDGFIWGSVSSPSKTIVRIDKNFETTTFYIDELPLSNRYIGDVSLDGVYYLKGGGTTYYKIDLHPESETYGGYMATETLSQGLSIHDWAFNAIDGYLYTVEKSTNILYRIHPDNGQVSSLGEVPILSGLNYTYGAVYFDASGRFYVSANQTGTIYVIQNVQELDEATPIDSNLFAFGPSSSSNDGARCPTAPVLQEICDNGIDDDGDGLIDCEDPSCSSYGMCVTIDPEASSANKGGLESNNRLSDVIKKRNYNRLKTNYIFQKEIAPLVEKKATYATKNEQAVTLQDFIPLQEINEDYVVESTPLDLIEITNATEVFSVDYIENNLSKASILALKTENGVYEHTKYICDRLLGAELISVSTIEINDQQFIKSLIKNIDGTVEFVLGLSARVVEGGEAFSVESHWNLDRYEANATFYNFQIWARSIDDLHILGQQVLHLLEVQKPITSYTTSSPPPVFVRKGNYANGALHLEIINVNNTESVVFDAGKRATETSDLETWTTTLDLEGDYISYLSVPMGHLFDVGFRIGDGVHTPDDLFLSDGPWGLDVQDTTTLLSYEVTENENSFDTESYPIERNIHLSATTSTYVAAYRALTARFQAVDVSAFNVLQLSAKGTGMLQITLVKESIEEWEDQFKTTVALTDSYQDFELFIEDFSSPLYETFIANDLVAMVFTLVSDDGTVQAKEMYLEDLRLSRLEPLTTDGFDGADTHRLLNYPNPFSGSTAITLPIQSASVEIMVVDMLGRFVDHQTIDTQANGRTLQYINNKLHTGVYMYTLIDTSSNVYHGKFIVQF